MKTRKRLALYLMSARTLRVIKITKEKEVVEP